MNCAFPVSLNLINKLLVHKLKSIHSKQNQKQNKHESNKLCMLQTRIKKQLEVLKIGDNSR